MTEATFNEINEEIAQVKPLKYSNLLKEDQIVLDDLQKRHDFVNINTDTGGGVVITDITD